MRSASQHAIGMSNQIALQIVSRRMSAEPKKLRRLRPTRRDQLRPTIAPAEVPRITSAAATDPPFRETRLERRAKTLFPMPLRRRHHRPAPTLGSSDLRPHQIAATVRPRRKREVDHANPPASTQRTLVSGTIIWSASAPGQRRRERHAPGELASALRPPCCSPLARSRRQNRAAGSSSHPRTGQASRLQKIAVDLVTVTIQPQRQRGMTKRLR
jgi:hypothetical protein